MTTVAAPTSIERELAAIVGEAHVRPEQVEINGVTPPITVLPASVEEVAAVLRLALERELVVAPAGGCTRQHVGGIPERIDVLLRTERLNQVLQYDPGDLTIGAGAGLRLAEMQRRLRKHQQSM